MWTEANTWFSSEEGKKGQIKAGQLADLAVLALLRLLQRARGRDPGHHLGDDGARRHGGVRRRRLRQTRAGAAAAMPDLVAGAPRGWLPAAPTGEAACVEHSRAAAPAPAACTATAMPAHGPPASPASDESTFWGALGCSCWAS
ncbi:hypothetical protein ACU4GD_32395 [Cupriavidus basilensis]